MTHIMKDTSLDAFDEIFCDGSFGEMTETARQTIEDNPDLTVKELLKLIPDWDNDRNKIAPKVTVLANEGVVIRPHKRKCTVTGKKAYTHQLAPESWRDHRARLFKTYGRGKYVKNRLEIDSNSQADTVHTCIEWSDGTISCSCGDMYHRTRTALCSHTIGMMKATQNRVPKDYDWKAKHTALAKEHDALQLKFIQLIEQHKILQKAYAEAKELADTAPLFGTREDDEDFS